MNSGTVKLKAEWYPAYYDCSFDANGGTISGGKPSYITIEGYESKFIDVSATKKDDVFVGWACNGKLIKSEDDFKAIFNNPSLSDIKFIAKWQSEVTPCEIGNHDFLKYVPNTDGTHKVVCKDCDAVQDGHDKDACTFDAGVVTKQPTTSAEGVKTYACTACGYAKTEAIAKLTEDSKPETPGKEDPTTQAPTDKPVAPKKGQAVTDKKANAVVKVTVADPTKGEVEYTKPVSSKGTIVIPDTVTINGVKYKVTSIKANAFKNNKKLKKVTIGKNIKKIGKNAFYGCKNLKTITIKTTKLTTKKVGSKAFTNIHKKATVKVPKKKLKAYKTMLKKRGISKKTQKIKK